MMELMAQNFPGVFSGYKLSVTESHQRNKADVSGTAKAVVGSLQRMGVEGFKEVSATCFNRMRACLHCSKFIFLLQVDLDITTGHQR